MSPHDHHESGPWPTPEPGQARLTLLGSNHLATPGNDEHGIEVDDTLAPARQRELEALRAHLERRPFDHVAVEVPRGMQADLDRQYDWLRTHEGDPFTDETGFPEGPLRIRGEAVQVACRLAASLGHDRVHAVDSHPPKPDVDADFAIDVDSEAVPYPVPDVAALVQAEGERLAESSLPEVYRAGNRESSLQTYQAGNVVAGLSSSGPDDHVGARLVGYWYERNARILENLARVTGPDEETLFVVGSSHVVPLRQLATAEAATCPRPALPLLEPET